ncbi:MAG TPA: glycoside hydrolase family 2 TIM barrel-domain containing protein [Bryobacteraceae bacterium]|nr:glycoside hydrolase family 2 TIM barrel-domain containing protein [Bryobacteraceae bacterium]HOQ46175.1 glycoside hydrolase family 2 TIM barrel-domain containing protein [Bryobacteraceae bacterium]HPQ14913.1 glycoside hydrolase family 2 TIM barrel-domain containing protein [Bryobacteraceae bacterium]HPU72684.1 glycoside hydrolase family 2 TIM barrel-domain containing protein [Bryobacteraceae bacterium]
MRKTLALFLLAVIALAAPSIPRAEYPRPQFQREQWLNLNGQWEFEFDDANVGLDENWASGSKKFSRTIVVPYSFESALSGIHDTSFHPWVWYRRSFTVPAAWKGKRILLHFGAVNYWAMVWINGRLAGQHEGGSTPFSFDITPLLQAGTNTITVRSEFPPTDRTIPRGKQYWEPKSRSIFYTRTSGIWQTVWLEPVAPTHLERVRITAGADGVARFEAEIARPEPDLELHATLRFEKAVVASASAPARGGRAMVVAGVAEPRLWSPNSPNLYDVTFELRRGAQVIDRVESYLGFRTVSVEGGRILLNRRPIYLKMVLDQGYWPQSNLTPPSDEAIQYDIKMTKEMGFNGARKHQKLEDPRYLYWADRLGLLVSSEMANAYEYSEAYIERFTKEWMAALQRDYNHPSIIMWVPINESWGTPDLYDSRQQFHLKALYTLTKSFDSTRPVIDNDGWEHTDMTDIFAIHDYARTGEMLFEKYKDIGKPGAPIPDGGRPALAPGYTYNGTPIVLSEFGGIAYIPAGQDVPKDAWGYSGVEKTPEAALQRLRGLYEAIAKLPFAGLCYTQLTDVEQEVNGLMTYDRKLKFDPSVLREINRLVR